MTTAEVVEKALRANMRVCGGSHMSGAETEDATRIVLDALAGAGLVVVSAEDLRVAVRDAAAYDVEYRIDIGLESYRECFARLRSALAERSETDG